eukprot:m.77991 g.77991  ORF g.77991 m.77991 type:complete len:271 (+) comp14095_c0_seq1:407-1219(+)
MYLFTITLDNITAAFGFLFLSPIHTAFVSFSFSFFVCVYLFPSIHLYTTTINNSRGAKKNHTEEGSKGKQKGSRRPFKMALALPRASTALDARPEIVNLVATVNLGSPLDLTHIALHARNAEYSPKRFSAVIMRIRAPQTTALVFATGKMICTGAKSVEHAYSGARKFAKIIKKLGFTEVRFRDFTVQNVVARCDVKFPIRLESVQAHYSVFSTYEPELFPGLIFRMAEPRVVILIFVSGKVVITGAKKEEHLQQAFDNIFAILQNFKKS